MLRLNFLCGNYDNKVERDFLLPLLLNKKRLRELGLHIRFFSKLDASLTECDILCILSAYIRLHGNNRKKMDLLKEKVMEANRCFLFETTDSTGAFAVEFIPMVERYYKKQLLKNRNLYLNDLYNKRIVFDYYHRRYNINEKSATVYKNQISESDLTKFRLSWNVGLGDYYIYPRISDFLGYNLYLFFDPTKKINFNDIEKQRDIDVMSGFSLYDKTYSIIHFHRKTTADIVNKLASSYKVCSGFLPKKKYFKLLGNSKLSICPFGAGEISWKDFEAFISGSAIVKPSMNFMETWPNYYQEGETYQPYNWDFSDLEDKCIELLEDKEKREYIAAKGQTVYMNTISEEGKKEFCIYLKKIIS